MLYVFDCIKTNHTPVYEVGISQLIRYSMAVISCYDILDRGLLLHIQGNYVMQTNNVSNLYQSIIIFIFKERRIIQKEYLN